MLRWTLQRKQKKSLVLIMFFSRHPHLQKQHSQWMMRLIFSVLLLAVIAFAITQEPGNSFQQSEYEAQTLELSQDEDSSIIDFSKQDRQLKGYSNNPFAKVCCSRCYQIPGNFIRQCLMGCKRGCYPETSCLNAGTGVYAAFCQSACLVSVSPLMTTQLTPQQCAGACSSEVQLRCSLRCDDLFPGCNADYERCLQSAVNCSF